MVFRIPYHLSDWNVATAELSFEEEAALRKLHDAYYLQDGVLADDDRANAYRMRLPLKRYRRLRAALVGRGHIAVHAGRIAIPQAEPALENMLNIIATARANVKKRWRKCAPRSLKGNDSGDTDLAATHQPDTHQPDTHQPDTHQPDTHQPDTGRGEGPPPFGPPAALPPFAADPDTDSGLREAEPDRAASCGPAPLPDRSPEHGPADDAARPPADAPRADAPRADATRDDARPAGRRTRAAAPRGTRLPSDWRPDARDRAFAAGHGIDPGRIDNEADRFVDYWRSLSGRRAVRSDWPAAWRNWIRIALEGGPGRRAPVAPPRGRGGAAGGDRFGNFAAGLWEAGTGEPAPAPGPDPDLARTIDGVAREPRTP
jgi:hypothetical protein